MYFLIYKGIDVRNNKEWFCLFNDSNLYTQKPLFVWKSKNDIQRLFVWGLRFEKNKIIYEGYKEKDIPIIRLPYESITSKEKMKFVLVRKRKDLTDNKRFLAVTSTCALGYFSYQDILYYNQKYGFTNIVKGDVIRTIKGEIPIVEGNKYTLQKETEMIEIVDKNDKAFRSFIDDNHIIDNLNGVSFDFRNKKSLIDTALFGDSSKILDVVSNFKKKPFMDDTFCSFCLSTIKYTNQFRGVTWTDELSVSFLSNQLSRSFLEPPCKYCEEIQNIYRFSTLAKKANEAMVDGPVGLVSFKAPYDLIFDKQKVKEDLRGMFFVYHEYVHYLSSQKGNSGFVINDASLCDSSYIDILDELSKIMGLSLKEETEYNTFIDLFKAFFNYLTEGLTEILAGFLLYKDCEIKIREGVYFYEGDKKCDNINDIKYMYSPILKDLKSIGQIDILFKRSEDREQEEYNIYLLNSCYFTSVQVIALLMDKLGVEFIVNCFFNNKIDLLWKKMNKEIPNIGEFLRIFQKNYMLYNGISFDVEAVQSLIDTMGLKYELIYR